MRHGDVVKFKVSSSGQLMVIDRYGHHAALANPEDGIFVVDGHHLLRMTEAASQPPPSAKNKG